MKIIAVIPARYDSSRFPGKPLADINGNPMIWWVYQQAKKVTEFADVIVATDHEKIMQTCENLNMKAIMTSNKHPTGTDRAAEVTNKLNADYCVIVQGDEPLIKSEDQLKIVQAIKSNIDADAFQLIEPIDNPIDAVNSTTIKAAINNEGYCLFLSRAAIPVPKAALDFSYYKSVGCFGIKQDVLNFFVNTKPGNLEQAEEIELLRLLENQKKLYTVKSDFFSLAVDTPTDLERVKKLIKPQN
ncbi:MAG: 3-deoxy-manno-octulosonate cytidylyltransferase [Firmicutes bacterium]|nr:3-deoxy-manno-octulosonate cytidylyltransferase [Bacillota bacterium]